MCRFHAGMCNLQRGEESGNYGYKGTAKLYDFYMFTRFKNILFTVIKACVGKKGIYDEERISTFEGE